MGCAVVGGAYTRTKAFRVGCETRPRGPCRCYATRSNLVQVRRVMVTDNSLLMWAKSIAPQAEESAVWTCRAGAGGQSRPEGSEKGHGRILCRFPFEKRENKYKSECWRQGGSELAWRETKPRAVILFLKSARGSLEGSEVTDHGLLFGSYGGVCVDKPL